MYTNIFLDADDTLLDFKKAQLCGFKDVIESYGYSFSDEMYSRYENINHSLWKSFEAGSITKHEVQHKRFSMFFNSIGIYIDGHEADSRYQHSLESQNWLIPYAEDVCKMLSQKCVLTILTNGVGKTQHKRIASSAISPFITNIVVSEDLGVAKPAKEFFEYALTIVRCSDKKNVLMVGDSLFSDMQGANNAGIDACWYNPDKLSNRTHLRIRYTISDLRQLIKIVFDNNQAI